MRLVALVAIAVAAIWFGFVDNDWLDRRPAQRVLFLGDSYTYYNDMPSMVTEIADSAGSDIRYDITVRAFPNATLEGHWNNARTRSLLTEDNWDRIIVQPESYFERLNADSVHFNYGSRLLPPTGTTHRAIVVSWTASDGQYANGPVSRVEHFRNIEANSRALASRTGADLIDVAQVWEDVSAEELPFSLYKDGNHPSVEGSYLAALVIYAELTQADVTEVTYVPWGMSGDNAAQLRDRVQQSLRARGTVSPARPSRNSASAAD